MTIRTTDTEVTFTRPFLLSAFDVPQPAGTYHVVIEEEEISGLSFIAYRRTTTMLQTPAISVQSSRHQSVEIDPEELSAALDADALACRVVEE